MTLSELRTQVRQRANMENSQFVTDAELLLYINASYGELYDILVSRFEDYYLKSDPVTGLPPTFTLSGGTYTYALPSDLYKLRGLDVQVSGATDWATIPRFNFDERNSISRTVNRLQMGLKSLSYRVIGSKLYVLPEDQAAGTYRLWYIPRLTKLAVDADDVAGTVMDFEEYIIVDAAMKCLLKEESDVTVLMAVKEQLRQRILAMSANRDAGSPERVADVRGFRSDDLFPW
jgi:hypothetical protein